MMEMSILHNYSCIWLITHWYICFMRHIVSDYICMRMYGSQNWLKVTALLVPFAYPLISPIFSPYFRLYLSAIFCLFVVYDVGYFLVEYHAKLIVLTAWIKSLNAWGACCAHDVICHTLRLYSSVIIIKYVKKIYKN